MRRCALVCVIFISTGISSVFGQTLTETIVSSSVGPIPESGGLKTLVPCGGSSGTGYIMRIHFNGLTPGSSYVLTLNNWFNEADSHPVLPEPDGTYILDIVLDFTQYQLTDDLIADYTLLLDESPVPMLIVNRDPFIISNPNYAMTTTYYDGSYNDVIQNNAVNITPGIGSCIPTDGGSYPNTACLYYQNNFHPFTRITIISVEGNSLDPNSLTLSYTPENDIRVSSLRIQCIDGASILNEIVQSGTPNVTSMDIPLSDAMILHLANGNEIRVVEEFVAQECGSVALSPETTLSLIPCTGTSFVQNHTMNVLVNSSGKDIEYCFNIEDDGVNIDGIPLFNHDNFDIRFTFTNPTETGALPNTGHKELGWIVLPIDLKPLIPSFSDSWDMADVNTWLSTHTFLQLELDNQGLTANSCSILSSPSPLLSVPVDFARVYEPSMAYDASELGACTAPDNVDPLRRVVLDFSTLTDAYFQNLIDGGMISSQNSPLTNWYTQGEGNVLWNTFMEGARFSVLFENMEFDPNQFISLDGNLHFNTNSEINTNFYFRHCESVVDCQCNDRVGDYALFRIPQLSAINEVDFHFYSISRNMCDRLELANSDIVNPAMPILRNSVENETCPNWSTEHPNELFSPLKVHSNSTQDLLFRSPKVNIDPITSDATIEDQQQSLEVDFHYKMDVPSGVTVADYQSNPWDYSSGVWESLFDCDNSENRGRVSIPLALAHRCHITVKNHQHPNGCDNNEVITTILNYNWDAPNSAALSNCSEVYILDLSGERQPLFNAQGDIATCSLDNLFYVDFNMSELSGGDDTYCDRINIYAKWTYPNVSCPPLCVNPPFGGTQDAIIRFTTYTVCRESEIVCPPIIPGDANPENSEFYVHKLGCSETIIHYICGDACIDSYHCYSDQGFTAFNECTTANSLNIMFNTRFIDDNGEPAFRMTRNTFGYQTVDQIVSVDLDGNPLNETHVDSFNEDDDTDGDFYLDDELVFNQGNGHTTNYIATAPPYFVVEDEDGNLDEDGDGILNQDEEGALNEHAESLIHFLPGDQIKIEASGWYNANYTTGTDCSQLPGNALLTYVIQTELDESLFELPCVPGNHLPGQYEITLTFSQIGGPSHVFHASDFIKSTCNYMENHDGETETRTTLIFEFADFYNGNCADGTLLTGNWNVSFNGFVFMNPNASQNGTQPISHLNEELKGSFALLDPNYTGDINDCPIVYSCDNTTTVGNYHELSVLYSLKLDNSQDAITNCTRPYHLMISYRGSAAAHLNTVYGDEYRPIFGIKNVNFKSTSSHEYLDLDHHYWGNPQFGAGLWYLNAVASSDNVTANRNFYARQGGDVIFNDNELQIQPRLMGMPELNDDGLAVRTIYGTAEVKTSQFSEGVNPNENQQIGESFYDGSQQQQQLPGQLMQCQALTATMELDYYLDDHITDYLFWLEGACAGIEIDDIVNLVPIQTYTDLRNNPVGFISGLTQNNEILSSTGTLRSSFIDYFQVFNSNLSTSSFFVTVEDRDDIQFTNVRLIKVHHNNITNTVQNFTYDFIISDHVGEATTYYFHQGDYYNQVYIDDPYKRYSKMTNLMFLPFNPEGNNTFEWYLEFEYILTNCQDGMDEANLNIPFYFGQACAWYENEGDPTPNFSRCQTCLSKNPNCPDCQIVGSETESCSSGGPVILDPPNDPQVADGDGAIITLTNENSWIGSISENQQYHTGYDGFVGNIAAIWGNQLLSADISSTQVCDQMICINLHNNGYLAMDAEIHSISLQYSDDWGDIQIVNSSIPIDNINPSEDGTTLNINFALSSIPNASIIHGGEQAQICFQFLGDMSSVPSGNCLIDLNARTICGNEMEVDNFPVNVTMGGIASLDATMDMSVENCNPVACITYTNDGDQQVSITAIDLSPYSYSAPDVSGGCIDCDFNTQTNLDHVVLVPGDQVTADQLVLAPGASLELCFTIPIEDPLNYQNVLTPLNITTHFTSDCGNILAEDYPTASGSFQLYQNPNFGFSFNKTMASCLNGVVQSDGSVDIQPHDSGSMAYEWTTFPDGFVSEPFNFNPTNMPVGSYALSVTDNATGCMKSYEVVIESAPCCDNSNSTLSGTLTLDEANQCIPRLCGSISGQSGTLGSITISYPSIWSNPVLASYNCNGCLAAPDYSVPGAVTLNFTQNFTVDDLHSFDFCFDFNMVDLITMASELDLTSADLVMNFNYLSPCGETFYGQPSTAIWEAPNLSMTGSLEINIDSCSPVACMTYTNDGDEAVFISSISLAPYNYGEPDVTSGCTGCMFTTTATSDQIMLIPSDDATLNQLQLAPGETIELCIEVPISDPWNYQNLATPLDVTTFYEWGDCGSITSGNNLSNGTIVSSGSFQLYQNFDFQLILNATRASCLNGIGQNDGSVNIEPYYPYDFIYEWTSFPSGFQPTPFVSNPSNMPKGAYVLTLTDIATGCQMSYHLIITQEECCEITLGESDYDDCLAKYKFSIDSECESPNISVEVLDPNGAQVPFLENFWTGILDVSFETTIDGEYTIEIVVSCGAENPCGALSVGVISTPECSSAVVPNCFAIWDDEVVNNFRMEGNAVISHANSNSYSVLGSAHNAANDELNYYWQHLDLAGNNISNQAFGNDALTTSTDEYVLDAVEHNGYIYNVGYGLYDDGNGMHECLMISKIDLANGSLSASKRYSLSNSSNERATCIDTYVNSNGETQLIVAGYTDLEVSRGVNAFATSFSLSLDLTSEFFLYDVNSRDNFMYEVKNISQASVFVLVGKGMIAPSIFGASALMLDYNFNIVDEFTFYKRPSEITSVGFDGNDLYFAGNYIEDVEENIAKAMIFKTGLSWGPYISFTTLENTDDNEAFDWARDLVIHNSDIYIAGQSGLGGTKGLLIKVDPGEGELEDEFQVVWSKQTTTKHTTLKAITDVLNPDGSSGIIAVGDTQSEGEDAIAVVHSDLEGNTCCLETTTVIPDQIEVQLTNGYMRGTKTPFPTDLLTGSINFADLPMCDPLIKSAQVGLKVSTLDASLHVIPNPNDGQFELILSSAEAWLTEVVVIDVTGQVIFKSNYPTKDQLRSLSIGSDLELNAGMYLVQVRLSNGEEMSTRVVVGRQ